MQKPSLPESVGKRLSEKLDKTNPGKLLTFQTEEKPQAEMMDSLWTMEKFNKAGMGWEVLKSPRMYHSKSLA